MLGRSLDGVDREMLYKAVRAGLKNEDGRARGSFGSVYRNLSAEEIKPLLPAILQAVVEPAPSGIMFADGIRLEGLRSCPPTGSRRGSEGLRGLHPDAKPWASEKRTPKLMEILLSYGAHAKPVIPELEKIAADFADGEAHFPKNLSVQKAAMVRETIDKIKASNERPQLIRIH
jgi:hypothetical protein